MSVPRPTPTPPSSPVIPPLVVPPSSHPPPTFAVEPSRSDADKTAVRLKSVLNANAARIVVNGQMGAKSARLVVPPSEVPYEIEFIYPLPRLNITNTLTFVAALLTFLIVAISQQSRKR